MNIEIITKLWNLFNNVDKYTLIFVTILIISGLVWILDSSSAITPYNQTYYYFNKQLIFVIVGSISAIVAYYSFEIIERFITPIIIVIMLIMFAMLIPGVAKETNGASRWISFGLFDLQIIEFLKVFIIIYLSKILSKMNIATFKYQTKNLFSKLKEHIVNYYAVVFIILGLVISLASIQKDLGSAIVLFLLITGLIYLNDSSWLNKTISVSIIVVLGIIAVISISGYEYRLGRFEVWYELFTNGNLSNFTQEERLNKGYQAEQMLIAIGSGGIWGVGFTNSIQKYYYLVDQTSYTDNIFAVISEETGLIGATSYIVIYYILFINMHLHASRVTKKDYALIAHGLALLIVIQAAFNISANLSIIPLKGLTLPFISYGGSSLISLMIGLGFYLKATSLKYN